MKPIIKNLIIITIILLIAGGILYTQKNLKSPTQNQSLSTNQPATSTLQANNNDSNQQPPTIIASSTNPSLLSLPINSALERVTKKPFGIKISPSTSPVQPERFSGYHTGVDFETLPDEQNIDVPIFTVCAGPLLLKEWASGYGGVAVQKCQLENSDVTIIYGHLNISSVGVKTNANLAAGDQIGILGRGYSSETDNERKHLHLGIHEGSSINIKGYVQSQNELNNWLDALKYLK